MASSSSPINVRATQVAEIISIKGSTARMRFGGKTWDVTIEDRGSLVPLNERLASVVQTYFQDLCDKAVISRSDKVVELHGHHDKSSADTIIIDKVLVSQSKSNPVKDVEQKVQQLAIPILQNLSTALSNPSLFIPSPDDTLARDDTIEDAKGVFVDVEVDQLKSQFETRDKTIVTKPFDCLEQRLGLQATSYNRAAVAKFIGKVDEEKKKFIFFKDLKEGNSCEHEPIFSLIHDEIKYLNDKLQSQAYRDHLQADGLESVLSKSKANLSIEEKRKLVVSYGKYLKDSNDTFDAGPSFYKFMVMLASNQSAEYNLVVIDNAASQGALQIHDTYSVFDKNKPIDGSTTLFLHIDNQTGAVSVYEDGPIKLKPLRNIDSISKKTERKELHRDLKDPKTSALRALALQSLEIQGQAKPQDNQVSLMMRHLRDTLPDNIDATLQDKVLPSAKKCTQKGLQEKSLLSHKMLKAIEEVEGELQAINGDLKKKILDMTPFLRDIFIEKLHEQADQDLKAADKNETFDKIFDESVDTTKRNEIIKAVLDELKKEYEDWLNHLQKTPADDRDILSVYLEELKNNPDQDFDEGAFILLSSKHQIAVLEDSSDPSTQAKPLVLKKDNFYSNNLAPLNPSACLLLYRGADGKYRSMLRNEEILKKMTHTT